MEKSFSWGTVSDTKRMYGDGYNIDLGDGYRLVGGLPKCSYNDDYREGCASGTLKILKNSSDYIVIDFGNINCHGDEYIVRKGKDKLISFRFVALATPDCSCVDILSNDGITTYKKCAEGGYLCYILDIKFKTEKIDSDKMSCELSDFARYGNCQYPVTKRIKEYVQKYGAFPGYSSNANYILYVYDPVQIVAKFKDKPLPRPTKAIVDGWLKKEEIQRIYCANDDKWYVIKFRCELKKVGGVGPVVTLSANHTKLYVGQSIKLIIRSSEYEVDLIKYPTGVYVKRFKDLKWDPNSQFYVTEYEIKFGKPGTYKYQAITEDYLGNTATSNVVEIKVEERPSKPAPSPKPTPKPEYPDRPYSDEEPSPIPSPDKQKDDTTHEETEKDEKKEEGKKEQRIMYIGIGLIALAVAIVAFVLFKKK